LLTSGTSNGLILKISKKKQKKQKKQKLTSSKRSSPAQEKEEPHQLKRKISFFLRRKFPVLTSEKILHVSRPAPSLWNWARCSMFTLKWENPSTVQ
jgi:hypothetical protein